MTDFVIATFYHFTRFEDPAALREHLLPQLIAHDLKGTVLLAPEGVNGTLAGSRAGIDAALEVLRALPNSMQLEHKESHAKSMPFYRLKVRLKKEIVTMKVPGVDPLASVGTHVAPKDWNELIADPQTIVIDARNDFEVEIGTFEGAINPGTASFSDLPQWLEEHRAELENKKIAMFCTGGIRCEKATSYLKERGIRDVFHLKGGILKYLETIPEAQSRWRGECFVFDYRVSVKHDLKLGEYELCYACRWPVNAAGRESPNFVAGISCDHCINQRSEKQRARYVSRQEQIKLAKGQGALHVGANYKAMKKKQRPRMSEACAMPVEAPILYSFRRCPYAIRARMAIAASGQTCALREVVLRNKPPEMIAVSPKATVPVMVLPDGRVIEESLEIMHWALDRHDLEGWLTPLNNDRDDIDALIAENDGPFKDNLDRYKYPNRFEISDPLHHRAEGEAFLKKLNARLLKTIYLCGDDFTFSDAAIAPFIRQFANNDRDWFNALDLSGVQRWLQSFLDSDRFLAVMEKYPAWESGMDEITFFPG